MNISFLQDDTLDTIIVDSANERPLYEVQTLLKRGHRTTFVRRTTPGKGSGTGELISVVHWSGVHHSSAIYFLGSTMPMGEFLGTQKLGFRYNIPEVGKF